MMLRHLTIGLCFFAVASCGSDNAADPPAVADTGTQAADTAGPVADTAAPVEDVAAPEPDTDEPLFDAGPDAKVEPPNECSGCHGAGESSNPPPALDGSTDPSLPGVGAHAAHVGESDWHGEIRCKHCHTVPKAIGDPGHIDEERPADVVFGGVPSYAMDPAKYEAGTCAVYCHGRAMAIEPKLSAAWTSQEKTTCTTCHGMPPKAPHPQNENCGKCHVEILSQDGKSFIKPSFHMDTILQAPHGAHFVHLGGHGKPELECDACHNGTNYHGPFKDGKTFEETTVCAPCHAVKPSQDDWVTYPALANK